jgi:Ca2+/H+ antiporter
MNRFQTARDAKEYLVRRILKQADQDGVSISDVERDMLYFSETDWTLPNMMEVSRDFDQNYDQDQYESKVGQIVQRIHAQDDGNMDDSWDEAVRRLLDEDHYLSVLINGASRSSSESAKMSRWDIVRLILASILVVAVSIPISFFVFSHVDNPAISKFIAGSTLLALVVLAVSVANRGHRNSA